MSTFSSVIHKPGKKFAPKAGPRRHVHRQFSQDTTPQPSTQASLSNAGPNVPLPSIETGLTLSHTSPLDDVPFTTAVSTISTVSSSPSTSLGPRADSQSKHTLRSSVSSFASGTETGRRHRTEKDGADDTNGSNELRENASVQSTSDSTGHDVAATRIPSPGTKRKRAVLPVATIPAVQSSAVPTTSTSTVAKSPTSNKRQNLLAQTAPGLTSPQGLTSSPPQTSDETPAAAASEPTRAGRDTESTDAWLQNATTSAAAVSSLADAIENNTRSATRRSQRKRPKPAQSSTVQSETPDADVGPSRRKSRKQALQRIAAEVVADAAGEEVSEGSKQRKRRQTPDGAEDHEIEPAEVKMVDLCRDGRFGKKSTRETAMQGIDWDEVKKQRKEAQVEAQKRREISRGEKRAGYLEIEEPQQQHHLEMEIVDGNIVVVEESRMIDRQALTEKAAANPDRPIIEEKDITKRVNQNTVGRRGGIAPGTRWDEEMTERFYKGLRMFGTDFMMISSMFPEMTRKHIKLKYVKEEKTNPARVHENLKACEPVNLGEFEKMTDKTFDDPKKVQEEMDADEKRLRAEDEQRRAREFGPAHEDDEAVLQSREQGSAEPIVPVGEDAEDTAVAEADASAKENRFSSIARRIVQDATAPKSKRKQTGQAKRRDTNRRGRRPLEGVEEKLGPIDQVAR